MRPGQISMARFEVRVVTNAREFSAERGADGTIRCRVPEKPEKGKANLALIKGLSKLLGCDVRMVSGAASRRKVFEADCGDEDLVRLVPAARE
jgi:uncharacterized protein YggU (UPF0235/DUF167 family)